MEYLDSTRHVVIDIETLGLEVGCPIIQIGAVEVFKDFGKWTMGSTFCLGVSIESNIENGFINISKDTLKFWCDHVQMFEKIFEQTTVHINEALLAFHEFLNDINRDFDYFWCKGTDFDFPILKNAFEKFDLSIPWGYAQVRDIRTIQDQLFYGKYLPQQNNHDALLDAENEANILIQVLTRMEKLWPKMQ